MPLSPSLLGQLLSSGLGGYSGAAASALLEIHPEVGPRTGPGSFELWKQHFEERLSELAAALAFEEPQLFAAGGAWARVAYSAHGVSLERFDTGLRTLEAELAAQLPADSESVLRPYFEAARASVASELPVEVTRPERQALEFLERTLEGEGREAAQYLLDLHEGGATVAELFEEVVVPAQREVGDLWHRGEINVAEEHLATLTTQKAIALLAHHAASQPANRWTVVVSSVTGDAHDLGLRLVAELFGLAGWRSVSLGSDVPRIALLQALDGFGADLLVLSATLARHLLPMRSTIQAIREHSQAPGIRVLVGGGVFRSTPELWRQVGADGYAARLHEAVALGERLVVRP